MALATDKHSGLTAEYLRSLFDYDKASGHIRWASSVKRPKVVGGSIAGSRRSDGSWAVRVDSVLIRAHRLAWVLVTGKWPEHEIDHADRDCSNNRWDNLREATRSQNLTNRAISNATGYGYVSKSNGRYRARARINGKMMHVGMADTAEDAHRLAIMHLASSNNREFVISQLGDL